MKMSVGWLSLCLLCQGSTAGDLGTWGDVYPVAEKDMLNLIIERIEQLEHSAGWPKLRESFFHRVIDHSERPSPVRGINRTRQYASRYFDPSVRIAADLKDEQGRIFARQGEVINPLKFVPFMQTLYFINGDDPLQVAWMKRQQPKTVQVKIILVRGDIPKTSVALDSRIYFDQNGKLCERFGITEVPTRITPMPGGERLYIEAVPAERQS
jgi:conjugal transfer pilus assembly protein TraW